MPDVVGRMVSAVMAKRTKLIRDSKLDLRLAAPLRAELERAADDEGRTLSELIRRVLVDFAAARQTSEQQAA